MFNKNQSENHHELTDNTEIIKISSKLSQYFHYGFIATITVLLITFGTLAFSLAVLGGAQLYSDSVSRREWRAQANLNVVACLDTAKLMIVRDYFMQGHYNVPELGCDFEVVGTGSNMVINLTVVFMGTRVELFEVDPRFIPSGVEVG